jgi:hypothetical protein
MLKGEECTPRTRGVNNECVKIPILVWLMQCAAVSRVKSVCGQDQQVIPNLTSRYQTPLLNISVLIDAMPSMILSFRSEGFSQLKLTPQTPRRCHALDQLSALPAGSLLFSLWLLEIE